MYFCIILYKNINKQKLHRVVINNYIYTQSYEQ